jgi:hypothetical protein
LTAAGRAATVLPASRQGAVASSEVAMPLGKLVAVVAAVTTVCFALAGLIGQDNDGPLGGLPEWLGAVTWFGFLIGLLLTVVLGVVWLGTRMARGRRTT